MERPFDKLSRETATKNLLALEVALDADVMLFWGSIVPGVEKMVQKALALKASKRQKLAIVMQTNGGSVELVERMVTSIRNHYQFVDFYIPDSAYSAGTVFVMSGDAIWMNNYSVLGPIDPQVSRNGTWVPALGYLRQFEDLTKKGHLSTAEAVLLQKFDPGELYQFKLASELSVALLKTWLVQYKFKDWTVTETNGTQVTPAMKTQRAEQIASELKNIDRWHSHSRGINMAVLAKMNLKIHDYTTDKSVEQALGAYYDLMSDFLIQQGVLNFIHTAEHY